MTLAIGDHLRIERNGVLVQPENELYQDYEVVAGLWDGVEYTYVPYQSKVDSEGKTVIYCGVLLKVVK